MTDTSDPRQRTVYPDRHLRDSHNQTGADLGPDQLAALVRECVSLMHDGGIARLKLSYGELSLSLNAHKRAGKRVVAPIDVLPDNVGANERARLDPTGHVITAPMIGTFYRSSAPGESPFVSAGDHIEEGQTIGIIEAMKIMNEIAADRAGIVEELIAENGQTVEYGSPLIRLSAGAT